MPQNMVWTNLTNCSGYCATNFFFYRWRNLSHYRIKSPEAISLDLKMHLWEIIVLHWPLMEGAWWMKHRKSSFCSCLENILTGNFFFFRINRPLISLRQVLSAKHMFYETLHLGGSKDISADVQSRILPDWWHHIYKITMISLARWMSEIWPPGSQYSNIFSIESNQFAVIENMPIVTYYYW
jgi:hypothetical protein